MSTASLKTPALVSVRYVISSILNRLEDYSFKRYKRLTQIAIEGFSEDFAIYHTGVGNEVIYLHMSDAKIVPLPADFIDYIRIGYPLNGQLRVITRNDNLLFPRTFDTGEDIGNTTVNGTSATSGIVFFSDHFRNGVFVGGLFGVTGGIDDAYFRLDMENRQIVFSGSTPRSEIVMEYLSSGIKIDGSSLIPREIVSPLRNYVLWQMIENDPKVAYNMKQRAKTEYEESIQALRFFKASFSKDEYLTMCYRGYKQSIKR
jgi:hypothetical protein